MVIANIHLAILNLVMNSLIDYEVLKLANFESKGYISLDQITNHDGTHILSCLNVVPYFVVFHVNQIVVSFFAVFHVINLISY